MFSRSGFSARSFLERSWRFAGVEQTNPSVVGGSGGRARHLENDDALRQLVEAKWDAIEAAKAAASAAAAQAANAAPALAAPPVQAATATSAQTSFATDVAAAPALLPGAAQRAIEARRRDDEEALLLLLLEA